MVERDEFDEDDDMLGGGLLFGGFPGMHRGGGGGAGPDATEKANSKDPAFQNGEERCVIQPSQATLRGIFWIEAFTKDLLCRREVSMALD